MLRALWQAGQRSYTSSCCIHQRVAFPRVLQKKWAAAGSFRQETSQGEHCQFHTSTSRLITDKDSVRKKKPVIRSGQEAKLEKMSQEQEDDIDLAGLTEAGMIVPTLETSTMSVAGIRYDELPIVHIKASQNNTIMVLTDCTGSKQYCRSTCGSQGFKNVKKSTNVAAQATGLYLGNSAVRLGHRYVRVAVRGLGVGRLASMKGMQMAGIQIVSITDTTPIPHNGPRPRKARRL